MIDDPLAITALYASGAAALSLAMAKFSPSIGRRLRHLFSGFAPLAGLYGGVIARDDVIRLDFGDILFSAFLVLTGVAASVALTGNRSRGKRELTSGQA
ncbi:hypothetical protein [Paraurantiacibacter namhicola]|uniref:Uncharacterized protein n=1 Tax=Paraurantiacibacter namhicola TaxID=645517 RepID=A0A1C7D8T1_9SPHN|nr:hypothetical protein [Paraurantiacibacter namhicola]ANU07762.1 hypothetical protein A6F65_01458 [Paraurantiacibacter namhicola]